MQNAALYMAEWAFFSFLREALDMEGLIVTVIFSFASGVIGGILHSIEIP